MNAAIIAGVVLLAGLGVASVLIGRWCAFRKRPVHNGGEQAAGGLSAMGSGVFSLVQYFLAVASFTFIIGALLSLILGLSAAAYFLRPIQQDQVAITASVEKAYCETKPILDNVAVLLRQADPFVGPAIVAYNSRNHFLANLRAPNKCAGEAVIRLVSNLQGGILDQVDDAITFIEDFDGRLVLDTSATGETAALIVADALDVVCCSCEFTCPFTKLYDLDSEEIARAVNSTGAAFQHLVVNTAANIIRKESVELTRGFGVQLAQGLFALGSALDSNIDDFTDVVLQESWSPDAAECAAALSRRSDYSEVYYDDTLFYAERRASHSPGGGGSGSGPDKSEPDDSLAALSPCTQNNIDVRAVCADLLTDEEAYPFFIRNCTGTAEEGNQNPNTTCQVSCDIYQRYSQNCSAVTGNTNLENCLNNQEGCLRCETGFVKCPSGGGVDICQPPTTYSPCDGQLGCSCLLSGDYECAGNASVTTLPCPACSVGYTGSDCQTCADGFVDCGANPNNDGAYCRSNLTQTLGGPRTICDSCAGTCECVEGYANPPQCNDCGEGFAICGGVCAPVNVTLDVPGCTNYDLCTGDCLSCDTGAGLVLYQGACNTSLEVCESEGVDNCLACSGDAPYDCFQCVDSTFSLCGGDGTAARCVETIPACQNASGDPNNAACDACTGEVGRCPSGTAPCADVDCQTELITCRAFPADCPQLCVIRPDPLPRSHPFVKPSVSVFKIVAKTLSVPLVGGLQLIDIVANVNRLSLSKHADFTPTEAEIRLLVDLLAEDGDVVLESFGGPAELGSLGGNIFKGFLSTVLAFLDLIIRTAEYIASGVPVRWAARESWASGKFQQARDDFVAAGDSAEIIISEFDGPTARIFGNGIRFTAYTLYEITNLAVHFEELRSNGVCTGDVNVDTAPIWTSVRGLISAVADWGEAVNVNRVFPCGDPRQIDFACKTTLLLEQFALLGIDLAEAVTNEIPAILCEDPFDVDWDGVLPPRMAAIIEEFSGLVVSLTIDTGIPCGSITKAEAVRDGVEAVGRVVFYVGVQLVTDLLTEAKNPTPDFDTILKKFTSNIVEEVGLDLAGLGRAANCIFGIAPEDVGPGTLLLAISTVTDLAVEAFKGTFGAIFVGLLETVLYTASGDFLSASDAAVRVATLMFEALVSAVNLLISATPVVEGINAAINFLDQTLQDTINFFDTQFTILDDAITGVIDEIDNVITPAINSVKRALGNTCLALEDGIQAIVGEAAFNINCPYVVGRRTLQYREVLWDYQESVITLLDGHNSTGLARMASNPVWDDMTWCGDVMAEIRETGGRPGAMIKRQASKCLFLRSFGKTLLPESLSGLPPDLLYNPVTQLKVPFFASIGAGILSRANRTWTAPEMRDELTAHSFPPEYVNVTVSAYAFLEGRFEAARSRFETKLSARDAAPMQPEWYVEKARRGAMKIRGRSPRVRNRNVESYRVSRDGRLTPSNSLAARTTRPRRSLSACTVIVAEVLTEQCAAVQRVRDTTLDVLSGVKSYATGPLRDSIASAQVGFDVGGSFERGEEAELNFRVKPGLSPPSVRTPSLREIGIVKPPFVPVGNQQRVFDALSVPGTSGLSAAFDDVDNFLYEDSVGGFGEYFSCPYSKGYICAKDPDLLGALVKTLTSWLTIMLLAQSFGIVTLGIPGLLFAAVSPLYLVFTFMYFAYGYGVLCYVGWLFGGSISIYPPCVARDIAQALESLPRTEQDLTPTCWSLETTIVPMGDGSTCNVTTRTPDCKRVFPFASNVLSYVARRNNVTLSLIADFFMGSGNLLDDDECNDWCAAAVTGENLAVDSIDALLDVIQYFKYALYGLIIVGVTTGVALYRHLNAGSRLSELDDDGYAPFVDETFSEDAT